MMIENNNFLSPGSIDYNDAFINVLKEELGENSKDYPLKDAIEQLIGNHELNCRFEGKDSVWLRKEIWKWRDKIQKNSFCGTLQSLQIYCRLRGISPNEVLLPEKFYIGPKIITFLSSEAIIDIADALREDGTLCKENHIVPVLYAPTFMVTVFLFIYSQRISGSDYFFLRFGISDLEENVILTNNELFGGVMTYSDLESTDTIKIKSNGSRVRDDEEKTEIDLNIKRAYKKIEKEFIGRCDNENNSVHLAINSFYKDMRFWTRKYSNSLESLFSWYPPFEIEYFEETRESLDNQRKKAENARRKHEPYQER